MAWLFRRKRTSEVAPAEQRSSFRLPTQPTQFMWGGSWAGEPVTIESALRTAVVAACVRVLKTTITNLPVDEVLIQGKRRKPVESSGIVKNPSLVLTQRQWVAQVADSMLTAGNTYGRAFGDGLASGARPQAVETIHPSDVVWRKIGNDLTPLVNGEPQVVWPRGDFIHIPATAFLRPGCRVADSPVELAKEAIGTSLAAERFGAQFFGDGAHPSSIIKSDEELDRAAAQNVKNAVVGAMVGREPAVLGSGLEYQQIQIDPKDSQFIDLLRFEVEQGCRFWGVPPSMVYAAISGQNITYSNVTETDLSFLKYSVTSWLLDIEDAWSSWLTQPRVVKFNVSALLRMDDMKRHQLYKVRLESKTISVNQIHALEDEEPVNDFEFDKPGIPGGAAPTPVPPREEPPQ